MQVISSSKIELSGEERELIIELLDRERTSLPKEIHHTRTAKFKDGLKYRLTMVEALVKRLTTTP